MLVIERSLVKLHDTKLGIADNAIFDDGSGVRGIPAIETANCEVLSLVLISTTLDSEHFSTKLHAFTLMEAAVPISESGICTEAEDA